METSWWLDLKLGVRMFRKHPGLTLAGGLGISVSVAIAVGGFSVVDRAFLVTSLPFAEGDRIVSLELWDTAANRAERRIGHDFALWRDQLRQVRELGAFRTGTANLIAPGIPLGTVQVAAISAAAFRVTGVQPLLGRYLLEGDERDGAPPVAVIGEALWRRRFAADAAIVGRQIALGSVSYTVAGVMPDGYAFPVAQNVWTPLTTPSAAMEPLAGQELLAFGRLAPGATLASAQAELTALTARQAADHPRRYELLRPRVLPYAFPFAGLHDARDAAGLHLMQGLAGALLVLVCLNVAILVYSRTAMRQGEIAVRTALGAGRGRIIVQLFTEALVLAVVASAAGVGIAAVTLREIGGAMRRESVSLPFWISFELSPGAVLWAAGLAVLAAAIIGILPALRATRGVVSDALRVVGSGASGLRLGATWTTLIIAQVAFAVALLPAAVYSVWESMRSALAPPGFAASECLTARLTLGNAPAGRLDELIRALAAEPAVSGVTFAAAMPGDEPAVRLEAENGDPAGHEVRLNRVGADFFQTFGVPLRTGRSLTTADAAAPGQPVVVNEALARSLFHGDALGRRVRIGHGPWREIVGVTADFPAGVGRGLADSRLHLFEFAVPSTVEQPVLAVRLRRGAPVEFAAPLREIAARIDPAAELRDIFAMDEVLRREQWIRLLEGGVFAAVTLSVLLLSAAGIYALMSLTVSQRRKEIGIRTALGADPRRLLLGVFSRALRQLGLGAALGMAGAAALEHALWGNLGPATALRVLPVAAAILVGVGLLGVAGPARRSLRIAPAEALREQ